MASSSIAVAIILVTLSGFLNSPAALARRLILQRNIEVGQVIGAGSQGLFRLARGGEMEMRAQLSQQDLAAIRVGMPASVTPIGSTTSVTGLCGNFCAEAGSAQAATASASARRCRPFICVRPSLLKRVSRESLGPFCRACAAARAIP